MLIYFFQNVIKYDLVSKFNYFNLSNLPKITKIVLSFNNKYFDLKKIAKFLLIIELIVCKKGNITKSKISNLVIKIKKGNPTGCKVTLHKKKLYSFLNRLIFEILAKNIKLFYNLKNNLQISFKLKNLLNFFEIEQKYYLLTTLNSLQIVVVIKTGTKKELGFLLNSLKL